MRVLFSLIFLLLCQAALSQYYRSSWSWKWELTRYDSNQIALIDNEANLITGFDFEDIEVFYSEYVAAKKAGKWGFITRKGRAVVPFLYEAVNGFSSNRACVKQNGKWGVIDTNGVFLLQPQFDFPLHYVPKMGFYSYKAGEKTGFVDTLGNILSPPQYYDVEGINAENGLISGRTREKRYPGMHGANMKSCCTVLIDRKGQNITGEKYNDIHIVDRKRGIYRTTHGTYLDSLGNLVPPTSTPNKWDWVNSYYTKSAFFTVKKAVRDSIIWSEKEADFVGSANGIQKEYCPPPPERVKIELEGLVNLKGEIILPIEYEEIEVLTANLFLVKKNKKYGIIDSTGGEILPFIYNKIYTHLTEYPILITKQDSSFYLFDASKTQPLTEKYASFKALDGSSWSKKERFLLVEKKGLNGLIDSLGREILPCQFVKIEELNRAFFKVHDGKAWGIWDTSGKSVQPCIYQKIEEWDDTKCKATIGGKLGILAINGTWIVKPGLIDKNVAFF